MQDCVTAKQARIFSRFRHSSSLGWVCLFAPGGGGGGGIRESIEIPTSLCLSSIGFETDRDLPDGICSQFVFCLLSP